MNSHGKHYPNILVCVKDNGKVLGKKLKSKKYADYIAVVAIRIRSDFIYHPNTLKFENVYNKEYTTYKYRREFVIWLYSKTDLWNKNFLKAALIFISYNKNYKCKRLYNVLLNDKNYNNFADIMLDHINYNIINICMTNKTKRYKI